MRRIQSFWKAVWEHLWKIEICKTSKFQGVAILLISIYSTETKGQIPIEYIQKGKGSTICSDQKLKIKLTPINLARLNKVWKIVRQTIGWYTTIEMKELGLCQMTWRDFPQVQWIKKSEMQKRLI